MPGKAEAFKDTLARLKTIQGVEGGAWVSRDGLVVYSDLPKHFDAESFSAMIAAMVGAAEAAMLDIGRDPPNHLVVEGTDTRILARGVTEELLLVAITATLADATSVRTGLTAAADQMRQNLA